MMSRRLLVLLTIQTVLSILVLQGCSTFNAINPFYQKDNEDLNALTYGDDYRSQGSDYTAAGNKSDTARMSPSGESRFGSDNSSGNSSRAPASDESFYETKDKDGDAALDPTDDKVRQKIAVGRGLAASTYKRGDRATHADFLDDTPNDGSLWSNEQDANYFFSKDKVRGMGDIISVKLDDSMIKQVAEEIKKSLTPAEQQVEMALYLSNNPEAKEDKDIKAYRNVAAESLQNSDAQDVKDRMEKAVRWSQVDLTKNLGLTANEELRAEIVDRYQNGNYKIRAVKRVLYRGSSKLVSLVAVAPAADFDDKDLIASGKLYEYKIKVAH
jgi:flagellar basal body L-ring protein FlgH